MELSYDFEDYVQRIINSKHDLEVYFSVKDDMRSNLNENDLYALKALGFKTDFEHTEYNDSFVAFRMMEILDMKEHQINVSAMRYLRMREK